MLKIVVHWHFSNEAVIPSTSEIQDKYKMNPYD